MAPRRYLVHVVGRYVERTDHRVQRFVYALHDLAVVALVLAGVGASGQLALNRGSGENAGVCNQRIHGVDAGVEVVLDRIEVAVVGVGDLGGNIALADAIDIVGGDIQWSNNRIQDAVDSSDDLGIGALHLVGVSALRQLPLLRGIGQTAQTSSCRVCMTSATLLTATFIFSWSPL